MRYKFIFLLLVGLFFIYPASAGTYFVTHDAGGGGDGSWGSPWTIAEGCANAVAGNIVKVQGGTYPETARSVSNSGNSGNPITFQADNGTPYFPKSSNSQGFIINGKAYIVIDGFDFYQYSYAMYIENSNHITVKNTDFDFPGIGIYTHSSDFNLFESNTITHAYTYGMSITYSSNSSIIKDNTISTLTNGDGISIGGTNNTLENNNINVGSSDYDYRVSYADSVNTISDHVGIDAKIRLSNTPSVLYKQDDNEIFSQNSLNNSYGYTNGSIQLTIENQDGTITISETDYKIGFASTSEFTVDTPSGDELVNFTIISGTTDWVNSTSASLVSGMKYGLFNLTIVENQIESSGFINFTTNLVADTYIILEDITPSTPVLVSPANTSIVLSYPPVTLNVSSTDADSDPITYYFYGGTSPSSMIFLGNNNSVGGSSFNWSISQYDEYYWVAKAGDGYKNSSNMSTAQFTLIAPPNLTSPTNSSTTYTTYPPLTSDVTFTWQHTNAPQYRIITATDSNFNVLFSDIWISTNTSTQSLVVNDEYWWRVYAYDGATYSSSSDIYSFNLTGNSTLSGSAIEGVVYADINGVYTALSSAEVVIWNATWSDSAITGSNGYYVFEGLASGQVYSVQAKKDLYIDSSVSLVTAGADPITNNFYLLPDRTSEEWRHYVKFTVQNIWGTKYPNVDVTVYENDDVTALYTATTGSDGAATFILNRQQEYRITFINSTLGISETRTLYPKDTHYYIIVSSTLGSWDTYTVPISDAIDFTISKNEINSTHAYINVSYNDSLAETTDLKVYLNQTNESDYFNQSVISVWNAGATSSGSHIFIVEDYAGESYIVHLLVTHTTYGTIDSTYSVSFKDDIATNFPGIPPSAFLYSSIFILMFTGGIFVHRDVERGMLIVCIMFFVFYGLGAFNTLPSNITDSMLAGGILAFILSIIANLNKGNKDEGFS